MKLPLKSEYVPLVLQGKKVSTIRAGERRIQRGPADIVSGNTTIPVDITEVESRTFESLDELDAKRDGFASAAELKRALRSFYPRMKSGDAVTIVHFVLR